jgi:multidrug efflux pump subunit AcrA (membrane-fusion protein)
VATTAEEQAPPEREIDLGALGRTWTAPQGADTTPEVSEILGEMPWWAARGLLYVVGGFVLVALIWAHFSVLDVLVQARGRLVPEGYVRPVQAAVGGIVRYVLVSEGDRVEAGEALLQIDDTEARARHARLQEELATHQEQLRQLQAGHAPVPEILASQNRLAQLESEVVAASLALKHTTVTAPAAGVVTTLDVRSEGAVVQPGQQVAAIAPDGVRLVAEVQVSNEDIAFVEPGLPAKLKLDAFPFQDYGTVPGIVTAVAADARADERLGSSFYKVTITPEKATITAGGRPVPLRPGLSLTAEIVTERKSVLALFTEPFRKLRGDLAGVR